MILETTKNNKYAAHRWSMNALIILDHQRLYQMTVKPTSNRCCAKNFVQLKIKHLLTPEVHYHLIV